MHAHALELLDPAINGVQNVKILDVGCGSGYLTACFGRMCEQLNGKVVGIDYLEVLVNLTRANIDKHDSDLVKNG